jgi:hypothetical protein
MAPPAKAPDAVLFGSPLGYWQPVNNIAEPAAIKVKVYIFIPRLFDVLDIQQGYNIRYSTNFNLSQARGCAAS